MRIILIILHILASQSGQAQTNTTPNDPLFDQQWGLGGNNGPHHIDATSAWAVEKGHKKVAIVVIDSGIDYTHPDLVNNMWTNPNEIPNNGIDDDNNGYIDDVHGVNVITGSGDPMDTDGHGTFMAGVIGAEGNNGMGVTGVMHHVSLIACKFLDQGTGTVEGAVKCLDYVADLATRDIGVTIVATNNAWGGGSKNAALQAAIERQRRLGILFVTTAGALAHNVDKNPVYPASYGLDNMIVTTSMNPSGLLASFASYGPNTVFIASPGQNIMSTLPNNEYGFYSGSASTGFVTGVVGLMKAKNPALTYQDIKQKIERTASPLASIGDQEKVMSGGYINANRCLVD